MLFSPRCIVSGAFLAYDTARFDIPTTGVVAGEYFYFIANSQLLQVIGGNGAIRNPEKLQEVIIGRVRLR